MSNAQAAYYAYRALDARGTARLFRKFRYFASADALDAKADTFDRLARLESTKAPEVANASGAYHLKSERERLVGHREPPEDMGDFFEPLE